MFCSLYLNVKCYLKRRKKDFDIYIDIYIRDNKNFQQTFPCHVTCYLPYITFEIFSWFKEPKFEWKTRFCLILELVGWDVESRLADYPPPHPKRQTSLPIAFRFIFIPFSILEARYMKMTNRDCEKKKVLHGKWIGLLNWIWKVFPVNGKIRGRRSIGNTSHMPPLIRTGFSSSWFSERFSDGAISDSDELKMAAGGFLFGLGHWKLMNLNERKRKMQKCTFWWFFAISARCRA